MSMAPGFGVEISIVDGRTADILLVSAAQAARLLTTAVSDLSPVDLSIARWLDAGKIIFDHGDTVTQAKIRAAEIIRHNSPTDTFLLDQAQHVNYDLRVNKIYASSDDPLYRQALRLRELHTFSNVFVSWFNIRGLPWEGEKKAIKYLQTADSEFLVLVDAWLNESDLRKRMEIAHRVTECALAPIGGVWPDNEVFEYDGVWEGLVG